MKCSEVVKEISQSWGGILAITIMLVLIIFAIFNSSGKSNRLARKNANWEDIQEQQNPEDRKFIIKDGQKLVVF